MPHLPGFSSTASLIADPIRTIMLTSLLDGRVMPTSELAYAAGVTPQTASTHLRRLLAGGLINLETKGRHRYYRLAGPEVAQTLKHLASLHQNAHIRYKPLSPEEQKLRFCRCCYDHLAGRVGVAITNGLLTRGFILASTDKRFNISSAGIEWFKTIGLDWAILKPTRRGLARQCFDWTEHAHHLAGPLGAGFMAVMCRNEWLKREQDTRIVHVTPEGWTALQQYFDIDAQTLEQGLP